MLIASESWEGVNKQTGGRFARGSLAECLTFDTSVFVPFVALIRTVHL